MKNNFYYFCLSFICLAFMFVSCDKNVVENVIPNQETSSDAVGEYTYKLHFNLNVNGEAVTRTSYDWNKNDEVYISFSNGTDIIEGVAKYDGSEWIISSSIAIPVKTSDTKCDAVYIENGNQKAQTLPYKGSGTYTHASSADDVYVNVIVNPQTWRLRFKGDSNTTIKLSSLENDIKYYSSYTSGNIRYDKSDVSLTVSNGYTPYIYGLLDKTGKNTITVENNGKKYSRTVTTEDLSVGNSSVMTIPTESNFADFGWTKVGTQDPSTTQLYREPCIEWGASPYRVKSFMSGYTIQSEDNERILFKGKNKETSIQYTFENNGLFLVFVGIDDKVTNITEIGNQLAQSFVQMSGGDEPIYVSSDLATIVYVAHQDGLYVIAYMDANHISSSDYFDEPYVIWGNSRSTVKSEMQKRGYSIMSESNSSSDDYMIAYYGMKQEAYSVYSFSNTQKLVAADVLLEQDVATVDDIRTFLESGLSYKFMGTNAAKDNFFYSSPDNQTCAIASSVSSGTKNVTIVEFVSMDNISSGSKTRAGSVANDFIEYDINIRLLDSDVDIIKAAHKNSIKYLTRQCRSFIFSQLAK